MGAEAAAGADMVIVTSDNPRSEDPQTIIDEILEGCADRDRRRSTRSIGRGRSIGRCTAAGPGDVVLIAGKGHETTQIVGDASSNSMIE